MSKGKSKIVLTVRDFDLKLELVCCLKSEKLNGIESVKAFDPLLVVS